MWLKQMHPHKSSQWIKHMSHLQGKKIRPFQKTTASNKESPLFQLRFWFAA